MYQYIQHASLTRLIRNARMFKLCRLKPRTFLQSVALLFMILFLLEVFTTSHFSQLQGGKRLSDKLNFMKRWQNKALLADTKLEYDEDTEQEVRHIAFLKVHKSASTTAQNIFLRFGSSRKLTFVIPVPPAFLYPNVISTLTSVNEKNIMAPPENKSYDILCCHVVYNQEAFQFIMPKDTVYIGIVRDPFDQFVSVLQYFQPKYLFRYNRTTIVSEYLQNPKLFEHRNPKFSLTNNRMAFEFGFPQELFTSKDADGIQQYLEKLESEFRLVIIVEHFDESLVLMKRYLNWSLKDIVYIKQNARQGALSPKIKFKLGDRERYRKWATLDYALYEFFYRRFWDQVRQQGSDFHLEVIQFQRIRKNVQEYCFSGIVAPYTEEPSEWNSKFQISRQDCNLMLKFEISFIEELRARQYPGKIFEKPKNFIPEKSLKFSKTVNRRQNPIERSIEFVESLFKQVDEIK